MYSHIIKYCRIVLFLFLVLFVYHIIPNKYLVRISLNSVLFDSNIILFSNKTVGGGGVYFGQNKSLINYNLKRCVQVIRVIHLV